MTIRLPQGLAMEFNFISEQIKTRVNGFFGYQAIDRIILDPYYDEAEMPKLPLNPSQKMIKKRLKEISKR